MFVGAKKFAKHRKKFRLTFTPQPLHLVLIPMRAQTKERRNARIEPSKRIGKLHRAQRTDLVAFAERNLPAAARVAAVKRENQRAIEVGCVISARGMAKLMFVLQQLESAVAGKLFAQLRDSRGLTKVARGAAFAVG